MSADFFASVDPGERLVVRFRLPGMAPTGHDAGAAAAGRGPHLSDVIGTFVSLDDGVLTLQTRTGPATVAVGDVTHAKRVPPAPQRRGPRPR